MQAGPYKIGCKLREIKILLRHRSLDFNQDKTKSEGECRLLLLMHIIDARIYADLEFEIHPSIPLINCPNNDCNWRNWRRQPIDTSQGQFQIHYSVSGLNTYGQNLLVQNTRCYYAWLWQVRMWMVLRRLPINPRGYRIQTDPEMKGRKFWI